MIADAKSAMNSKPLRAEKPADMGFTEEQLKFTVAPGQPDWDLNFVFTTTCSTFADLTSEGLVYTFAKYGVRGKLTRLDSCQKVGYKYPKVWARNYEIIKVPHFGPLHNKPGALDHWTRKYLHREGVKPDTTIVIIDPDMLLTAPPFDEVLFGRPANRNFGGEKGRAAGQLYGIGTAWVDKYQGGRGSCVANPEKCKISHADADKYFTAGPPIIIHKDDLQAMAKLWLEYTDMLWKKANKQGWAFDMDGYSMGMVQIGVKHNISSFLMTGDVHSCREGWNKVAGQEDMSEYCANHEFAFDPSYVTKHHSVLHYCHFYQYPMEIKPEERKPGQIFGKYEFTNGYPWAQKAPGLFDCKAPAWSIPISPEMLKFQALNDGKGDLKQDIHTRRNVYMINSVIKNLNGAFANYRKQAC